MYLELLAIEQAVSHIKNTVETKIVVVSDSKSALQHLARCTSNCRGTPIAYSILAAILELESTGKQIKFQWVPSHVGVEGNEIVDKFAGEASMDGEVLDCLPFFTDMFPIIRTAGYSQWKEYFDKRSLEKGVWYKTIQCSPLGSPWFERSILSRTDIVTSLRLRAGHLPLNKFAYLMRKSESPNCEECGRVEDVYHLLYECVRTESQRQEIYNNAMFYGVGGCNSVLAYPLSDEARLLYRLARFGMKSRR